MYVILANSIYTIDYSIDYSNSITIRLSNSCTLNFGYGVQDTWVKPRLNWGSIGEPIVINVTMLYGLLAGELFTWNNIFPVPLVFAIWYECFTFNHWSLTIHRKATISKSSI